MMQNNESNKVSQFFKTKGYYMLLGLCILAVGVSAYFFGTGAAMEQQAVEQSLSTPATVEVPDGTSEAQLQQEPADTAQTAAEAELEEEQPVQAVVEEAVMPVSGAVLQDYAMDRLAYNATTQDWRVHNGVDLSAALGTEVKAAKSGTVSAVYEDDYLGYTVVVQHSGGYTSHYCGLAAEIPVAAGETVTAGQVLGTVGNTARIEVAQEPHLHFEVYYNGESVDPAGFLY